MNLSGILVTVDVARLPSVMRALELLPDIELHQHDEQTGPIVLVQEATDGSPGSWSAPREVWF